MSEEKTTSKCDIVYLHYVNEQKIGSCTQVKFLIGSHQYSAILDTGCEVSILSEQLYKELKLKGDESLELPTQNVIFVGAFSGKAHRARNQVFLILKFGDMHIEKLFLVTDHLLKPTLIGYDFCIANGVILYFQKGKPLVKHDDETTEIETGVRKREEWRFVVSLYVKDILVHYPHR
jgi:hypothetical protein